MGEYLNDALPPKARSRRGGYTCQDRCLVRSFLSEAALNSDHSARDDRLIESSDLGPVQRIHRSKIDQRAGHLAVNDSHPEAYRVAIFAARRAASASPSRM
jgi:hypothetical protein